MKAVLKTIAKAMAKWVIGYLPDVSVWAIKQGAGKAKDSEKTAYLLFVVKRIATVAALVARIMEDGKVTEQEEAEVRKEAMDLVDQIKTAL
jgi:hypothetical protein